MPTTLYFEDFLRGQVFESTGRTITETDLTMFSMLSGDWNPIHADAEFARDTRFGQRVVHGALGIALATGMLHQLGVFDKSAVAMMSLQNWTFAAAIFVGQTLRLRMEILETEAGTSKRVGRVNRRLQLIDQTGGVIQDGTTDVLVLKRDAQAA
ncbi:MaoC/PaaZ C-terminal domain-containing protein [Cupriavidus basilensis]|uniref:MaoC family dehydratase n=1 Tax=Cupriavidus basilensis TaxID=68895 RepID=UPI0023E77C58|nr:MaoC/PaaZ C-terminal domain-containing protein [Cupriavidus basilensis]MDF3884998.1 MaoC/PaaZ C-terminal domain-containing protein [Cupriavidus basilensis]